MKIKLINPGHLDARGEKVKLHRELIPGLTLPYLAALFPRQHELEIIEEGLEELDYDEPVDLVGITAMTSRAPRAYWIADQFRDRGVPVVMGGFHVSALPEEALEHCDAVVQGEAEGLIDRILDDTLAGRLRGIYGKDLQDDLDCLPAPRYDLLKMANYIGPFYPVQATRGCPHQCDFCSVSAFYGRRHRKRPLDDVIADMKQAGTFLFIIDDNLPVDRAYALELFERMKPLHKLWGGQFNLAAANDPEMVRAAAAAGCLFLYVGVETVDPANLQSSGKKVNLNISAREAIRNLKRHHIEPWVSMIVGFEHDDSRTARRIRRFCDSARVPLLLLYILTPVPASPLYDKVAARGVNLTRQWHLYDGTHALFDTENMSAAEIDAMYADIYKNVYALPSILRRTLAPPHVLMLMLNLIFRQDLKISLHPWMGTRIKKNLIKQVAPVVTNLLTHPSVKRISRIIRYAEGRIIN
ncbi:MAG: B12-binding domain-containing radical SAM protein [Desulfosudaceae bacterium]